MSQVDFAVDMNYSKSVLNVLGPEQDMIKAQIQQDFVKADIYFKSLNVQTITQERKYTVCKPRGLPYLTSSLEGGGVPKKQTKGTKSADFCM